MAKEYQETEMSKRARDIAKKTSSKDSIFFREVVGARYDERFRKHVSSKSGGVDLRELVGMYSGMSYKENFLRLCRELNLEDSDVDLMLIQYFTDTYSPKNWPNQGGEFFSGDVAAKRNYENRCKFFGIKPDKNFPNW